MSDLHSPVLLAAAADFIGQSTIKGLRDRLEDVVGRHIAHRGRKCINLVAAEAPSSLMVRYLLGTDLGSRASGGAIGRGNRYFTGLDEADEMEALCIGLLTKIFSCAFADPRLLGGLHAVTVAYSALRTNGLKLMSLHPSMGGDSSNRIDGPAGILGMEICDIPVDKKTLQIDLTKFEEVAKRFKPSIVSLGAGLNLFPYPVKQIKAIISEWDGMLYFDGAHQAGLIAGGCYPNPLTDGADVMTGSTGKTFSGPQGGLICWNRPDLTQRLSETIFPMLTGTHQLNRVAALAAACLEQMEFGSVYMKQVVSNARSLAKTLSDAGIDVICGSCGFTSTHQVAIDAERFGGGHSAATKLAEAGIIANKVALPGDPDGRPRGVRFGTVEVTRLGMVESDMQVIGHLIADFWTARRTQVEIQKSAEALRGEFHNLLFTFDGALKS